MQKSSSSFVGKLLARGVRVARRRRRPREGCLVPLFTHETRAGWKYQVDYIYDLRRSERPFVGVYGFRPAKGQGARMADIFREREL